MTKCCLSEVRAEQWAEVRAVLVQPAFVQWQAPRLSPKCRKRREQANLLNG